jgi:hypothetical protein
MKAKEMEARFKANPVAQTCAGMCFEMIMETKALALKRGIQSNSALAAILREADDKWRAFARRCPEVNPGGFKAAVHKLLPSAVTLLP